MSVTEGSILKSIADCDRRIGDADRELERLRGRRAARWQEQDQRLPARAHYNNNRRQLRVTFRPNRMPHRCRLIGPVLLNELTFALCIRPEHGARVVDCARWTAAGFLIVVAARRIAIRYWHNRRRPRPAPCSHAARTGIGYPASQTVNVSAD
jgi:hypothetical protein